MIASTDPRHGTARGYILGCREECCRRAQMVYMKRYRMGQTPRLTDPTPTHRRLQALQALGHSGKAIGAVVGHEQEWARYILNSERITTTTATKVARAFDELCMTVPEGHSADRIRREARVKGWLPPLAWDDIDDVTERPRRERGHVSPDDLDPVAVERLLAGERIRATRAEKDEAMRRWKAMGRSERSLCEIQGWKDARYGRSVA